MMKAYPAYKDTGVEWLGQVPEGWEIRPIKGAFEVVGGTTPKSDMPEYWDGNINWVTPADLSNLPSRFICVSGRQITEAGLRSCGTTVVPSGSIVLSVRAPIGSLAIAAREVCTNQGCKALVPTTRANSDFYFFVLEAAREALNTLGRGSTFLELSGDQLAAFRVPLPPLPEQTAIAAFLDRETAKIDALVAEQRRLIDLLREKRQAVISHAVTKGLNPDAPSKPPGIDWLGDVPEGWEVVQLRYVIAFIESGTSVNATDVPVTGDELGVLKTSCVYTGTFDSDQNKAVVLEEYDRVTCPLREGALIVSRMNTPDLVGAAGYVSEVRSNIFLPDRLWQITFSKAEAEFIYLWTLTNFYRDQVRAVCAGTSSSMQNLSQGDFKSFYLAVPPSDEQFAIVVAVKDAIAKLTALTTTAETAIALLQERRAALISAAVTGKIDVRHLSPAATEAA